MRKCVVNKGAFCGLYRDLKGIRYIWEHLGVEVQVFGLRIFNDGSATRLGRVRSLGFSTSSPIVVVNLGDSQNCRYLLEVLMAIPSLWGL